MKHILDIEIYTKTKHKVITRKHHKNMKFTEPGMTVFCDYPYLAATPYLQFNCKYLELGLMETKCPATLIEKNHCADNWKKH